MERFGIGKILFLCVGIGLASTTAASSELQSGYSLYHDLPSAMSATATTRVVSGDFTGDLRSDTCMLAGGVAWVSFGTGVYPAIERIPTSVVSTTVRDIDFLPRSGGPGAFVILSTSGIHIVTYDEGFELEESITTGGWSSALALRVLDYGGSADPDIVGVASDRKSILRIKDVDGTRTYDTTLGPIGSNIVEIDRIDWTGDGDDELAVRRADGDVDLFDTSGASTIYSPTYGAAQLQAVRFPSAGDRLAVIQWTSGGQQDLALVGNGVSTTTTFLGSFDISAMASADTDGDGDGDLVLVNRDDYVLVNLVNRYETYPAQPFDATDTNAAFLLSLSTETPSNNRAEPVLHDFDEDGDADLAVVLGDDDVLAVRRNTDVGEDDRWVELSDVPLDTLLTGALGGGYDLDLKIVEPRVCDFTFDGIQVKVWRQSAYGASTATLEDEMILSYAPEFEWDEQTFFIDESAVPFDAVYTFEFRAVKRTSGSVTQAGPTSFFFYTPRVDDFDDLIAEAAGMPNVAGDWEEWEHVDDQAYSGGTGPSPGGPGGSGGGSGGDSGGSGGG